MSMITHFDFFLHYRMFKDLIREVCKGRGYAVTDIPFVNVAKNPVLKICNLRSCCSNID